MHYASLRAEDKLARLKDFTDEPCGFVNDLLPGLMYQYTIWAWNEKYDGLKAEINLLCEYFALNLMFFQNYA